VERAEDGVAGLGNSLALRDASLQQLLDVGVGAGPAGARFILDVQGSARQRHSSMAAGRSMREGRIVLKSAMQKACELGTGVGVFLPCWMIVPDSVNSMLPTAFASYPA
jgi:hypothetical protein